MFGPLNVFQIGVLVMILIGVVMIFMRQNNTCVMKQNETIEGFNEDHFTKYPNTKLYANVLQVIPGVQIYKQNMALQACAANRKCIGVVKNPQRNKMFLLKDSLTNKVAMSGNTSWIKKTYKI